MPKVEFTGTHYYGGNYRFTEPGTYDVDDAKAEQLLADFPDQFKALEGSQKQEQSHTEGKSLSKMNRAELEAVADEIGIEVTDEHDTNKKLKEAIEAKQKGS